MAAQALADTPCEFSEEYPAPMTGRYCKLTRQACYDAKRAAFVQNCRTREQHLRKKGKKK